MRDTNFRTLITEEEKDRILGLHKSYAMDINPIYEQATSVGTPNFLQQFSNRLNYSGVDTTTNPIKNVPGGKIYLVDSRYAMTPSYNVPACNADRSNEPCWSLDTMGLTGQYVDANQYILTSDDVQYDGPKAASGDVGAPTWFTDNGEGFVVVVHNGVAYGKPEYSDGQSRLDIMNSTDSDIGGDPSFATPITPPVSNARKSGSPQRQVIAQKGQTITQQGGGGEQEDKKELEAVKNDMQYSKGDVRRLKRNLNRLKRYRKRKANKMTSTIQAQYDALIKDLETKVGQIQ